MMLATSIAVGTQHDAYEGEAWPPAAVIGEVMGPAGLVLMVVAVSAGVLTGLNGFFTAASRVLFTLGRANLVSSRLGELNGKQRISRNAILLVCAVCLVTPWFGRMQSLHRALGAAIRSGLAWHAGTGFVHRAGGLDCARDGVVGYQKSAAEGCAAGGYGVVVSRIAGRLVSSRPDGTGT